LFNKKTDKSESVKSSKSGQHRSHSKSDKQIAKKEMIDQRNSKELSEDKKRSLNDA